MNGTKTKLINRIKRDGVKYGCILNKDGLSFIEDGEIVKAVTADDTLPTETFKGITLRNSKGEETFTIDSEGNCSIRGCFELDKECVPNMLDQLNDELELEQSDYRFYLSQYDAQKGFTAINVCSVKMGCLVDVIFVSDFEAATEGLHKVIRKSIVEER